MVSPNKRGWIMCSYLALLIPVALYFHFKSTMLAIPHYFCALLRCDPPRFYIVLLLSIILFIILVNAGLFKEDAADAITNDKHGEFQVMEVLPKSNEEEIKLENDLNGVDLSMNKSDCSKIENCTFMKEPKFSALIDDGEDEDINQFHKRVEAFISKVQVGFLREHKSLSLV